MKKTIFFLLVITFLASQGSAQDDAKIKGLSAITIDAVKGQLEFLASDWTEGRATGEKGGFMAGDYIASMFKVYGLKPCGDMESEMPERFSMSRNYRVNRFPTYFQNFNLLEYAPGETQELTLITVDANSRQSVSFNYRTDFSVRTGDVGIELNAPIVFVGYGISDKKNGYDEFKDIIVKGKIILRLSGFPGMRDSNSIGFKRYRADRSFMMEKNKAAEDNGATAVIEIGDNATDNWVTNFPFRFNTTYYEGDKPLPSNEGRMKIPGDTIKNNLTVITITNRVANEITKGSGIDFKAFEANANSAMKPASRIITGKNLILKTTVKSRMVKTRNIIGMIEGENPNEVVIIGAHYDHMGNRNGYIWNGADDNASGSVGVMTVAKAFMATGIKPKKSIIFALWTGEEKGLLGSDYFVFNSKFDKKMNFYLNYDMIARNATNDSLGNKCGIEYPTAYGQLKELTEKNIKDFKIGLKISYRDSKRPTGGSDYTAFSMKDVPVIAVMAAMHPDYHQPTDDVKKINWNKMTNIIKMGFLDLWDITNSDILKPNK